MTDPDVQLVRDRSAKVAPRYVVYAIAMIPPIILAQFLLAGLALFQSATIWGLHGGLGFLLMIPIVTVWIATLTTASIRPLRWWALVQVILYALQIIWIVAGQATGSGILQALHPFNAGLLLTAALVLVAKVHRSHAG
ncbi:DUF6220 domain-containing protein [Phreatobacter stygius]|uniref:Uncharacterized protein n=1 Tax=Phreatobacter stygius TaxID=1940610 RepID=A0A4D7B8E0_9HYPH|nr:DUF6220 domain-containing protein [Phreatobacter stygius]QCI67113.1 hypothetical protein E8M01_24465 [Phreatobacter stygius]